MASTLPPVPYKVRFLNALGFVSEPWSKFIRAMFERIGGIESSTNDELQAEIDALKTRVTAIETHLGI